MEAEMITAREAAEKGIGAYGEVMIIKGGTNGKVNSEMQIITDVEMLGECIFCHTHNDEIVYDTGSLDEIQKILEDDFLDFDEKIMKYRLTELAPSRGTKEVLVFMRIACIAFQISEKDLNFLRAFVKLQVMNQMNELRTAEKHDKIEEVKKDLGENWDERILELYKKIFPSIKKKRPCLRKDHKHLGVLCKRLKFALGDVRNNGAN